MNHDLENIAAELVASGKGILAADETVPTLTKRFDTLGIESTEDSRRTYREMLSTGEGLEKYISGVIMYDETIRQKSSEGTPLAQVLASHGIVPGIKVDTGAKPLAGSPDETVTEGLDGLRDRLAAYRDMGAQFAKWRAVFRIADALPSRACVIANAHALGRYAALCQEQHLVPIVEPEVLMDGEHSIERCEEVTGAVLHTVFGALGEQGVLLEHMLLKPNMVMPGKESVFPPRLGAGGGNRHPPLLPPACAGGRTGDRVPLRWSGGACCHGPPKRNQSPARSQTVDDHFFLWARTPGSSAGGVARSG
jgi:fructose-bisphosphate aldolase, class I